MKSIFFFVGAIILIGAFYAGKRLYFKPKYEDGELAPNFKAQLPNGEQFSLQDLKGHYILLDFWGSWCPPCRKENPEVVNLYDAFHGKQFRNAEGFEVVSVGIETDPDRWTRAIAKDKLNWKYHISDFQRFKSEIAKQYGVREVPTKYLINPEGKIIGVNQSLGEIAAILNDRLM